MHMHDNKIIHMKQTLRGFGLLPFLDVFEDSPGIPCLAGA